jgi:hypothetical protein
MVLPDCFSIAARNSLFSFPLNSSSQEFVAISSYSVISSERSLLINGSENVFWLSMIFSLWDSYNSSFTEGD